MPGTAMVSAQKCCGLNALMCQTLKVVSTNCHFASVPGFEEKWRKAIFSQEKIWQEEIDRQVASLLNWAACRAFGIAIVPLPLADVGPLVANEAYMIYRIGTAYGYSVDKTIITGFLGCTGASMAGLCLASFLPFLKAPIAAGITYAVGCAANAWFKSGMKMQEDELREIFAKAKAEARKMSWENVPPC